MPRREKKERKNENLTIVCRSEAERNLEKWIRSVISHLPSLSLFLSLSLSLSLTHTHTHTHTHTCTFSFLSHRPHPSLIFKKCSPAIIFVKKVSELNRNRIEAFLGLELTKLHFTNKWKWCQHFYFGLPLVFCWKKIPPKNWTRGRRGANQTSTPVASLIIWHWEKLLLFFGAVEAFRAQRVAKRKKTKPGLFLLVFCS